MSLNGAKIIMKENPSTFTFRQRSYQSIVDDLVEGIKSAYKECPNSENKTFEEVAHWAGQHVLLTEEKE